MVMVFEFNFYICIFLIASLTVENGLAAAAKPNILSSANTSTGQSTSTKQLPTSNHNANDLVSAVAETLHSSRNQLLNLRQQDSYWNFPLYLGPMYISQYVLVRHWLELSIFKGAIKINDLPPSPFDRDHFKAFLLQTQLPDGSWPIIYDFNSMRGDLNASILHYAALKVMGLATNDQALLRAKQFILKMGGIKNASLFTKIVLCLFGNYSWQDIPNIPYLIFDETFALNYKNFGQWIAPHLYPISYLQTVEVQKQLGPQFVLNELWVELPKTISLYQHQQFYNSSRQPRPADRQLLLKMLAQQKPAGSFGGYTTATLFSLVALQQYQRFYSDLDEPIQKAINKGMRFVDSLYFNSGSSSYLGVTCDGRYWDTALIAQGLLESGLPSQQLQNSWQYLFSIQNKASGGFGFGLDFEDYMDTDDTAEFLLFFNKAGIEKAKTKSAIQWLFKMQNDDGGWGAFDRNNKGNFILSLATQDFLDSADMFDESSPDVTGHILEALSAYGYTQDNSEPVRRAIDYLTDIRDSQLPAWQGRWGSNYIYGTSASLIGLIRAGVHPENEMIQDSVQWLVKCQNKYDGGFGESFDSYRDPSRACKGVSTPSQSAWALMALIEAGHGLSPEAQAAARYLVKSYKINGNQWLDKDTFVGTGHPKIVPMHYPSYAWAFSMMALSRYQKLLTTSPGHK